MTEVQVCRNVSRLLTSGRLLLNLISHMNGVSRFSQLLGGGSSLPLVSAGRLRFSADEGRAPCGASVSQRDHQLCTYLKW
jgi:hypothetical protein